MIIKRRMDKCPRCGSDYHGRVWLCESGHIYCRNCAPKTSSSPGMERLHCPVCNSTYGETYELDDFRREYGKWTSEMTRITRLDGEF